MRLERISHNEIKAYLTHEDIEELGIKDVSRLDGKEADVILGIAKAELGFDCERSGCEIFAETHGGVCTLTVTAYKAENRAEEHECILCFDNEHELYTACVYLKNFGISDSDLYVEDGRRKTYYLIVKYGGKEPALDGRPYWLCCVSELCESVHTDKAAFFYYISEHCMLTMQKNAVYDIAKSEKKW